MSDLIKYDESKALPTRYQTVMEEGSQENLKGVTPRLPKIQLPTGKGKEFAVEVQGEEEKQLRELKGVILYQTASNAYWKEAYGGGGVGVVPDCASHDGTRPSPQYENLQSDLCATCKHNRFGTAKDAQGNKMPGKACRNVKRLIFLASDNPEIPYTLIIPPSSIRKFDDYMIRLRKDKRPYWSVGTKIYIKTNTNKQNIDYPEIQFEVIGYINDEAVLDKLMTTKTEWIELVMSTLLTSGDVAEVHEDSPPATSNETITHKYDDPPF